MASIELKIKILLVALAILAPLSSSANIECKSALAQGLYNPAPDRNERALSELLKKLRLEKEQGVREVIVKGEKSEVILPHDVRKSLPDPEVIFSRALMAPLGILFDLKNVTANPEKFKAVPNESGFKQVRAEAESTLKLQGAKLLPEFMLELSSSISIKELSNDVVMVSVGTQRMTNGGLDGVAGNRLTNVYFSLVSWVYRLSRLEPDLTLTNARMLDEIGVYGIAGKSFEFHMLYDKATWHLQLLDLQRLWLDHKNGVEGEWRPLLPVLPFAGCATTVSLFDSRAPVEIKRYFKNQFEDSLELTSVTKKNEYLYRLQMLRTIVESHPAGAVFELHAHQEKQALAYKRMGFEFSEEIENPKYPGAKVRKMTGTREELLKRGRDLFKRYSDQ